MKVVQNQHSMMVFLYLEPKYSVTPVTYWGWGIAQKNTSIELHNRILFILHITIV